MMFAIGGALILVLLLVGRIVRWWNLPKVAEERRKKIEARQQGRTERAKIRAERRARNAADKALRKGRR